MSPKNLARVSEMKVTTDPVLGMGLTFQSFPSGACTMAGRAGYAGLQRLSTYSMAVLPAFISRAPSVLTRTILVSGGRARADSAEYWWTDPSTRSARGEMAYRLAATRVWSGFGGFTLPAIPLELYYPAMAESPARPQPVVGEVTSGDP